MKKIFRDIFMYIYKITSYMYKWFIQIFFIGVTIILLINYTNNYLIKRIIVGLFACYILVFIAILYFKKAVKIILCIFFLKANNFKLKICKIMLTEVGNFYCFINVL